MCKKTFSTYACGHIAVTWTESTPTLRIRTGYSPPLHPTFSIHALTNRAYLDIPPDYQYKECNGSMNRCCPIWDEAKTPIFVGGLDCEDCFAVNYAAGSCCGLKKGGVMRQNYDDLDWGVRVPGDIIVGQLTRKADKKQANERRRRERRRKLEEDEDDEYVTDVMPPSSVHALSALGSSDTIDPALVETQKQANLAKRARRELKEARGKKRWENEPLWSDVGLEEIMTEVKWMREPCLEELSTGFRSRRGWGMRSRKLVNGRSTEACGDAPGRWPADLTKVSGFTARTARLAVLE